MNHYNKTMACSIYQQSKYSFVIDTTRMLTRVELLNRHRSINFFYKSCKDFLNEKITTT